MAQKVVVKVTAMVDDRSRRKAMGTVAEIYGIDSIAVDMKEQKLTVIGNMDPIKIAKKLRKIGKIDIVSIGPAKEEKKEEKKGEPKKEEKKEEKKGEPKKEEKKEDQKKEEKKEDKKVDKK